MWAAAVLGRELEPRTAARRRMEHEIATSRLRALEVDLEDPVPPQCSGGGLAAAALENRSERFLLVGRGTGQILLRDVDRPSQSGLVSSTAGRHTGRGDAVEAGAASTPSARAATGHTKAVSSLSWFAADLGLFVSGGRDARVIVWDTNAFVPVSEFPLRQVIHAAALTPIPGAVTSKLVACASGAPLVRLCDMSSGAHTQMLKGHRAAVSSAAWSPASEYVLATGSFDRSIRLWDLRRSGDKACFATLDQHRTPLEQRRALIDPQHTAHDGAVTGLQFAASGSLLLSSGADCKMRLWTTKAIPRALDRNDLHMHEHIYENTFVNYSSSLGEPLANSGVFVASRTVSTVEGFTVYHAVGARGQSIGCFDVHTGHPANFAPRWSGHFMRITGLALRESTQELFSVGIDGLLLRWVPQRRARKSARPEHGHSFTNLMSESVPGNHSSAAVAPTVHAPVPFGADAELDDEDEWTSDIEELRNRIGEF
ncbi:DNA excision repair protein ERCC-8 [Hondaea fermentalgiana]|uniref:DNA excision repair protein ERCC-8 n=1 Tax=Hondaea fermentalgiana TaxID=2315210 RepID=A0A2R5GMD7_9STRA|nr:DNA excision repair protein ERCC-8 [Hondaea fermentalgiana]|eukprot:GBG32047.1 DNA excision repair protein ERCC-8 [Hondaea fermentalgiana]